MLSLGVFDRVFYSVKANNHPEVLARFESAGLGFECVSAPELEHVASLFPGIEGTRLLFKGDPPDSLAAWLTARGVEAQRAVAEERLRIAQERVREARATSGYAAATRRLRGL